VTTESAVLAAILICHESGPTCFSLMYCSPYYLLICIFKGSAGNIFLQHTDRSHIPNCVW